MHKNRVTPHFRKKIGRSVCSNYKLFAGPLDVSVTGLLVNGVTPLSNTPNPTHVDIYGSQQPLMLKLHRSYPWIGMLTFGQSYDDATIMSCYLTENAGNPGLSMVPQLMQDRGDSSTSVELLVRIEVRYLLEFGTERRLIPLLVCCVKGPDERSR